MTKKLSIILIALLFGGENLMACNNYTGMNQQIMSDPRIAALSDSIQQLSDSWPLLQQSLKEFNKAVDDAPSKGLLKSMDTQKGAFNKIFDQTVTLMAIAETSNVNYNERKQAIKDEIQRINEGFKDFNRFMAPITGSKRNVLCDIKVVKNYFDAKKNMINCYCAMTYDTDLPRHINGYVREQVKRLRSEIDQINLTITPQEEDVENSPQIKAEKIWSEINNADLLYSIDLEDSSRNLDTADRLLTDENVNTIINDIQIRSGISKINEMTKENIKETFNKFLKSTLVKWDVISHVRDLLLNGSAIQVTKINYFLNNLNEPNTGNYEDVSEFLSEKNNAGSYGIGLLMGLQDGGKNELQRTISDNLTGFINATVDLLFWQIEEHDTVGKQLRNLTNLVFTVIGNNANIENKSLLLCYLLDNIIVDDGSCLGYRKNFVLFLNDIYNNVN